MVTQVSSAWLQDIQAAWLGKVIGIRIGAPVEGWTAKEISDTYGYIEEIVADYDLFGADDDSNGPFYFTQVFNLFDQQPITHKEIRETILNMIPDGHSFFWWGGVGISTEHTMYENIKNGISAPESGSEKLNGKALAEQIGGQIFSDGWAYAAYKDTDEAVRLAAEAACISHDGEAIEGAKFVAAAISLAFTYKDIYQVMGKALGYLKQDSEYVRVAFDVIAFYHSHPDSWEKAYQYITETAGYDKYAGVCPIIPNMAVMVMAMCYGKGDFRNTLLICLNAGWDTDCNAGNVGSILGALVGIERLYNPWVRSINDICISSGLFGTLNMMDITQQTLHFARCGQRLKFEKEHDIPMLDEPITHFHFGLPLSTHGFRGDFNRYFEGNLINQENEEASYGRSLKIIVNAAFPVNQLNITKKTYIQAADIYDCRYEPTLTPIIWPNQLISTRLKAAMAEVFSACIIVKTIEGTIFQSDPVKLTDRWTELNYQIPESISFINEVGVQLTALKRTVHTSVWMDYYNADGKAKLIMDFSKLPMEDYGFTHAGLSIKEIAGTTRHSGQWITDEIGLHNFPTKDGMIIFGDYFWKNGTIEATIDKFDIGSTFLFRVQGARRWYGITRTSQINFELRKCDGMISTLETITYENNVGGEISLQITLENSEIILKVGNMMIQYSDKLRPIMKGCLGIAVTDGAVTSLKKVKISLT